MHFIKDSLDLILSLSMCAHTTILCFIIIRAIFVVLLHLGIKLLRKTFYTRENQGCMYIAQFHADRILSRCNLSIHGREKEGNLWSK